MKSLDDNLSYCNFAKTVLMLIVVLCHSAAFYGGNWFTVLEPTQTNQYLASLSSWLGTFHVQAFTLISGYIFYFLRKESGRYSDFKSFIINKARRLLVPYFAVSLFWAIPIGGMFYNYTINEVFNQFILGQSPAQLWFLLMLFNVFMIAFLLLDNNISWRSWGGACVGIMFALSPLISILLPNYFQIITSMKYVLFFYTGFMIRRHCPDISPKSMLRIGGILLLFNLLLFTLREEFNWEVSILMKMIKYTISCLCEWCGAVMAFFLLSSFASSIKWKNAIFDSISEASFPIYLFHQQIIYCLLWHFSVFFTPIKMSIICFCFSVLISWAIGTLMNKDKLTRMIIGGK